MSAEKYLKAYGCLMYDSEIISAVPMKGEPRDPTLHYCGGFDDHEGMGISVITAYDFAEEAFLVYLQDNLDDFRTIVNSRGIIIGFNNHRFDDNLAKANDIVIPQSKSFDMWKAITSTRPDGQRKGYSLGNLLVANGLEGKTGLGSEAPKLAQTGQWGKLITYCLSDTRKQVQILRLMCNDMLRDPNTKEYMQVKKPWDMIKVESGGLFTDAV